MAKQKELTEMTYTGKKPEDHLPKLNRIMQRLGVGDKDYIWNADRFGAWIDFKIDGKTHRFSHSIENAALHGIKLTRVCDVFAQLVQTLGDLERAFRYGTYTFDMFMRSLPMLEAPKASSSLPDWVQTLRMDHVPATREELLQQHKKQAILFHPDKNVDNREGAELAMREINAAKEAGEKYFRNEK
jgi:hypothetical protein